MNPKAQQKHVSLTLKGNRTERDKRSRKDAMLALGPLS